MKKYIVTNLAAGPSRPETSTQQGVRRHLSAVLPSANPDFDGLFGSVRRWWIEIDESAGVPEREIGFDESGNVIVAAPLGKNMGFWTDSDMTFEWREHPMVEPAEFEEKWKPFECRWQKGEASRAEKA